MGALGHLSLFVMAENECVLRFPVRMGQEEIVETA